MNASDTRALLESGLALHRQGRLQEALGAYQQVLKSSPNQPDALHYLGLIAHQGGNSATALRYLELAARLAPGNAELWSNYGAVHLALKHLKDAEECFLQFARLMPTHPGAHYALGTVKLDQLRPRDAEPHLRKALELQPDFAACAGNLGLCLQQQGRLSEAEALLRQALATDGALQPAWRTLAVTLEQQGRSEEAVSAYRTALSLNPQDLATHSALLLTLHYSGTVTKEELSHEARMYGEKLAHVPPHPCAPLPRAGRKLRIGYLSSDFHDHPVAYFFETVLASHDRQAFDIYCYASQRLSDTTTSRLMGHARVWRDISALSDEEAARTIAGDQLDLLVELGGHTGGNRLGVMAFRPAARQASWLGYFDTTGMRQIDALIADARVLPEGEERFYTERILRLPHYFLCFSPPQDAGDVAPLPMETNGYVTFGSFNKLAKLTPMVLNLWAEVLLSVPHSKLYLKTKALGDFMLVDKCVHLFEEKGVSRERLFFEGHSSLSDMYRAYGRMDIALDPFPHNGGTTSLQALWSGVPVLTLAGDRFVSRMGLSMMQVLGMDEWVAKDAADYVKKAASLAQQVPLATLRAGLRERLIASPLMDAPAFTQALEERYRDIIGN